MRAEPRSYTARILGFVLLCLLVWQTVGLSHVHMTDADYQHCEICTAFSGSPVMDPQLTSFLWMTADFQRINNPCYNADRGPVNVYSVRMHFEY